MLIIEIWKMVTSGIEERVVGVRNTGAAQILVMSYLLTWGVVTSLFIRFLSCYYYLLIIYSWLFFTHFLHVWYSPIKQLLEKSLLSQNKFQGCIRKPLKFSKGFHLLPNFYDGFKQCSIFLLFSVTQFSCLPRRQNTLLLLLYIKKLFRGVCT